MHWPTTFPVGATASRSGIATSGRSSPVPTRLRRLAQWLAPGLGVKRWVVLMGAGILLLSAGVMLIVNVRPLGWLEFSMFRLAVAALTLSRGALSPTWLGVALVAGGLLAVFAGLRGTVRAVAGALLPPGQQRLVDVLAQQRQRRRGPRIVVIGGGPGLSSLLPGFWGVPHKPHAGGSGLCGRRRAAPVR